jgi:hypothetical protein
LAFGGQDQYSDDGRPHTRLLVDGKWQDIHAKLQEANPNQPLHARVWKCRQAAKNLLAKARYIYFQGLSASEEAARLERKVQLPFAELNRELAALQEALPNAATPLFYVEMQKQFAREHLQQARMLLPSLETEVTAENLTALHRAQIQLELAAEALDAEPPARAMDCGLARLGNEQWGPASTTLVYDAKSKLYLLFGGDHLDYLTNDTWVFDPAGPKWYQLHPPGAPPPRANHRLEARGDGTVRMTGGYTYTSNTDYLGGQYIDLADGDWTYDIGANQWSGGKLVPADSREYRTGPFHPDYYTTGPKPNAAEFEAWLKEVPANEWLTTNPPQLPRLNRDWGTARIDPVRDMMLRWSGGHSAHGGTDVLHYHFATNRWELPFPVEFPLGQLYSNTSYPNGFNFNERPWVTGHTYQNYDFDPPSRMMIKAGRPQHFYVYDPAVGDWIGRGKKPEAMQYNSCFYTLTLAATPTGVVCWDKNGKVHRYEHSSQQWLELELTGDELPGAYVDNSSMVYDSNRNRLLIINTLGYGKKFDGQVWAVDLEKLVVEALSPQAREQAHRFANVDKTCFVPTADLMLLGTHITDAGEHTPTPAYDCKHNRWVTLDLQYPTGERYGNTTRDFPNTRSDGLMFDPQRKLIWGTNTNGQVYVLRLDSASADLKPLE